MMNSKQFLLVVLLFIGSQLTRFCSATTTGTPTFSNGTGTYYAPITVTISEATAGAVVYYTTNGTTPTTSSWIYSSPLTIRSSTVLKAMAVSPGDSPSAVATARYTVVAAKRPVISLAAGTYQTAIRVFLSDATPGAVIYYTTDGTTPTTQSSVYSGVLTFTNATSSSDTIPLEAIAVYPGGSASATATAVYTLLSEATPVASANLSASFLGMDVNYFIYGTPWPLVQVGTLRLWDTHTLWGQLNPASGTYAWSNLDEQIDLAKANNAQVLFTFGGTPAWALPTKVPIGSISRSGGVVTVTTETPHGLYYTPNYSASEQSSITIAGVSDSSFNGTFSLTGTPTTTTLTYAQAGSNATSTSGSLSAVCGGAYSGENGCAEAPAALAEWDQFVTAMINHVGAGAIQSWELWNEANLGITWRGDPKMLVSMAADARMIIKGIDPNAILLSPSTTVNYETPGECASDPNCGSTWQSHWLAEGGSSFIDGVAFHGYPIGGEAPEQIQGATVLQNLIMNQNGIGSLPLWDTESSWGEATSLPAQSDQIAFLGRHLLLENSMGIQRSFWYAYDNPVWGTLWSAASGLNPVGDAYAQVTKWITGATLTAPCAALASDPTTYTCAYSRANGYSALAVWNTAVSKSLTIASIYTQSHDLYGVVSPVSGGSVKISTSPILLETSSAF